MQSPPVPVPRYLVPPRSKYSPQHHVLKHPQLPFLPQCQQYKSFSSSLCNLPQSQSPVTSSLLSPNILLNTLFSNTLSFLSSRNYGTILSRLTRQLRPPSHDPVFHRPGADRTGEGTTWNIRSSPVLTGRSNDAVRSDQAVEHAVICSGAYFNNFSAHVPPS